MLLICHNLDKYFCECFQDLILRIRSNLILKIYYFRFLVNLILKANLRVKIVYQWGRAIRVVGPIFINQRNMSRTMEWAARAEHLRGIPRKLVIAAVGGFAKTVSSFLNTADVHNGDTLLRLVRSRPHCVPLINVSNHMSTSALTLSFFFLFFSFVFVYLWM